MSIAIVGTGTAAPPEVSLDRGYARKARSYAAEQQTAEITKTVDPENGEEPKSPILHSVTADLEQVSLAFNKQLRFVVDHRSNEITVKVIDRETDKVIKEFPPEELQRLHSKLRETIGFLFDERV
jgi:flagellar protein FlaG